MFIKTLFCSLLIFSAQALTLKVGVLAPEGTTWAESLKSMAKDIKKKTDGKVKLKIYYGGVAGDEPDVLRKIRVGQMHGGIFTGRALGDINGDVRSLEVPFTFGRNRELAWKTLETATAHFNRGFESSGFKNLGFFEIGMIYLVTTKKVQNEKQLKGTKLWSWQGDPVVEAMVNSMGLVSVPLSLPDVLSSLSTGIIEGAYGSTMGIVALQWNTKIKYLLNYPITFSIGAFLVDKKQWAKISPANQKVVQDICNEYVNRANQSTRQENIDALAALRATGVEILEVNADDFGDSKLIRTQMVNELKGKLFSEKAYNIVNQAVKANMKQ